MTFEYEDTYGDPEQAPTDDPTQAPVDEGFEAPLTLPEDGTGETTEPSLVGGEEGGYWSCCCPIEEAALPPEAIAPDMGGEPVGWCAPTGETAMVSGVDCNGDGIVDLCILDANGDGVADTWLLDTTGEVLPDTGTTFTDTMMFDSAGAGVPDSVCVDSTGTGTYTDPVQVDTFAPVEPVAPAPAPVDPAMAPAPVDPAVAAVDPAVAPAPAPVDPAVGPVPAPLPAGGTVTDGLIGIMGQTDDPQIQAQISKMIDIQTRIAGIWTQP